MYTTNVGGSTFVQHIRLLVELAYERPFIHTLAQLSQAGIHLDPMKLKFPSKRPRSYAPAQSDVSEIPKARHLSLSLFQPSHTLPRLFAVVPHPSTIASHEFARFSSTGVAHEKLLPRAGITDSLA